MSKSHSMLQRLILLPDSSVMKVKLLIVILVISIFLNGCSEPPDSLPTNNVGRDLDNFVDHTLNQKEEIRLEGNHLILYVKKIYDQYRVPGKGDKTYLLLHDTMSQSDMLIAEGYLDYHINYGVISPEQNLVFYTAQDFSRIISLIHLYTYDIIAKIITAEYVLLDPNDYVESYISDLQVDIDGKNAYYEVRFTSENQFDSSDYFCLDLATGAKQKLDKGQYESAINAIQTTTKHRGNKYVTDTAELTVFSIYPYNSSLIVNYKPKYNGIYISDGINNYRISREALNFYFTPIWLNNGKQILIENRLYDVSGKYKETKLVDGTILDICSL